MLRYLLHIGQPRSLFPKLFLFPNLQVGRVNVLNLEFEQVNLLGNETGIPPQGLQFALHPPQFPDNRCQFRPFLYQPGVRIQQGQVVTGIQQRKMFALSMNINQALAHFPEQGQVNGSAVNPADIAAV